MVFSILVTSLFSPIWFLVLTLKFLTTASLLFLFITVKTLAIDLLKDYLF